jgi:hypothetical protein
MQEKIQNKKILILGSCVSRDILNLSEENQFSLSDYYARSSISSVASRPYDIADEYLNQIESAFQKKMVKRDCLKELLQHGVHTSQFDAILIDLIDERFNLYEIAPDSIITLSGELLASGLMGKTYREHPNFIASGSERHRALWKTGVQNLFTQLHALNLNERVIINKVFWSGNFEDGSHMPASESNGLADANEFLGWMYEELEHYVPPERWMSFPEDTLRINARHQWGTAPFHYGDAYYSMALEKLEKITGTLVSIEKARLTVNNDVLTVNTFGPACDDRKFLFLVFKDNALVHRQPYSESTSFQFDTQSVPGQYSVVCTILKLSPCRPSSAPERITLTLTHEIATQAL